MPGPSTASVISSGFDLRLGSSGALTFDVAQGTTSNGVDLLVSGPLYDGGQYGPFGAGIIKTGAGTMVLSAADIMQAGSGPTTVNEGTLLLNGSLEGSMTVNGGTLGGTGLSYVPVSVNSGGTLPVGGASIGTLTIQSTLTLNSSSMNFVRISKTGGSLTNDSIQGITTLTYGGTLVVTNITSDTNVLAAGDAFPLFGAASYVNNFAVTTLPALGHGLAWSWTPSSGTLAVVARPTFTGFSRLANGGFSLTFSGTAGASYSIYATTNLALPISSWTVIANGTFAGTPATYQDLTATNYPTRFSAVGVSP